MYVENESYNLTGRSYKLIPLNTIMHSIAGSLAFAANPTLIFKGLRNRVTGHHMPLLYTLAPVRDKIFLHHLQPPTVARNSRASGETV